LRIVSIGIESQQGWRDLPTGQPTGMLRFRMVRFRMGRFAMSRSFNQVRDFAFVFFRRQSCRFGSLGAVSVLALVSALAPELAIAQAQTTPPADAPPASSGTGEGEGDAQAATAPITVDASPMVTASGTPGVDADGDGVDDNTGEILVIGTPIKGVVKADQPPIVTLDEDAIAAYGVSSIQELLSVLAPQTGSGRGRSSDGPVILLNGMRISSFREMRGLPPEAIRRVEVLPEEVALKYGYRPDQRVVNFILKDHYRAFTTETGASVPGNGSYTGLSEEATLVRIANKARLNVTGTLSSQGSITEAERGITQTQGSGSDVAGDPNPAARINASWGVGDAESMPSMAHDFHDFIAQFPARCRDQADAVSQTFRRRQ